MNQKAVLRYSTSFKRHVIEQVEAGRFGSIGEAREHFGIGGGSTIQYWLKQYGRNHLCAKVVRVEKQNEKDKIRELKKQIKQLKEILGQTQAEKAVGDEFLEMACEKMGLEVEQFKKKAGTMLFTGHRKQGK